MSCEHEFLEPISIEEHGFSTYYQCKCDACGEIIVVEDN